jgi:MFS transporter, UMF1 family
MFDFANQSYTLLIVTVVFGDLFTRVVVGGADGDYRLGNLLWSLALATSYLLVVLCAPVAGAIMDFRASKKRFLFASYLLTVAATAALYFVAPGYAWLGVILIVVSNFGYSIGEAFIASFLPGLGPPQDLGRISGFGWSLGYVGGMTSAIVVLLVLGEVSLENFERIRWVGPWAAAFFLVAAIPTFLWVRERGRPRPLPPGTGYVAVGIGRVRGTLRSLGQFQDLAVLLVSVFFAMSGIYIIVTFAFIYGAQVIGWDGGTRTAMFVIVQITAAVGAFGFGFIQDRLGAQRTYRITLVMWVLAILLIYLTPSLGRWLTAWSGEAVEAQNVFLVVGSVAGLSLGSCQSAMRTLVALFAPLDRAGEFFGFWGLALMVAGLCGLVFIGLLQVVFGLQQAVLVCVALFALALAVSYRFDEQRGRAAAAADRPAPER